MQCADGHFDLIGDCIKNIFVAAFAASPAAQCCTKNQVCRSEAGQAATTDASADRSPEHFLTFQGAFGAQPNGNCTR